MARASGNLFVLLIQTNNSSIKLELKLYFRYDALLLHLVLL